LRRDALLSELETLMDRTEKKCVFASTGLHLLLAGILVTGPAFMASRSKKDQDNLPVLDFVPLMTVDSALSGGGNPHATPPPAPMDKPQPAPPSPAPPPPAPPAPVRETTPPRDEPRDLAPPHDEEPSPEPGKLKKPAFEFTRVTRSAADAKAEAQKREEAEARRQEQEYARQVDNRRRTLSTAFGNAVSNIEEGRSGSTSIELKGPGGGGVPYANFLQAVKSRYQNAWIVPDGITDDNAMVATSVTIARDGTVVSARITRSSGNVAVDRSVQVTLDRVKWAAPLPQDAKENQRTVSINFSVAAKRGLG
jgi:TonB family protein